MSAKITGDASSFTKAFQSAQGTLNSLSEKAKNVGSRISDFGQKMSLAGAGITTGITTPFLGAIKTAADFDSAIRRAGAIAGASSKELDAMTKSALDLGASTSLSSTQVAEAMTEMAAKGFDAQQVIAAMPGVISAAEASGEDLALTADVVSSALNGFRLSADQSGKVADILAMAANKTAAGISDMGYAFKYAAPAAANLGISMEELSAATGIMVNAGMAGEQAGTTLRMAFNRLASPTKEASKTMEELGFSALDANGNFKPLNQIVGELNKSMAGMTEAQKLAALSTIFGTEAASGMLILLNAGQQELQGLTKELENSAGASAEAAAQMKAGIGGALENLSGAIESATISVMSQLTPLITDIAKWITSMIEKFNGLDDGTKRFIAMAFGIIAAAGPLLTIFGVMTVGIGGLVSAFGFLINPIGLVIGAITALGAVFGSQIVANEGLRNSIISVFSSIGSNINSVIETIKGIVQAIIPVFTTFFSSIVSGFQSAGGVGSGFGIQFASIFLGLNPIIKGVILLFQNFGPQIAAAFQQVSAMLIPVIATIGTALGQIAAAVIPVFMSALQTLIPVVIQVGMAFMNIVQMVLPVLISLINQLVPIITQIVTIIAQIAAQIAPLIGILISSLLPVIVNIIATAMNIVQTVAPAFIAIIQVIMQVIQALIPVIMSILTVVVNVVANIISAITPIVAFIGSIINAIMAIIAPIVTFIANIIANIIAVITPIIVVVTGIFNTVFNVVSGVFRNIVTFIGSAINGISSIISGISSVVSSVFNSVFSIVRSVMNRVSNTVTNVFNAIQGAWSGLTGFVSGVFSGISSSVQKLVNQVKGFINNVIGGINAAISLINKIPGVSIGKIPYLQHGTDHWAGGFAYMNEGGRGELVHLPNGAQVIPHDVSMKYAKEAAKQTSIDDISSYPSGSQSESNSIEVVVPVILEGREIARVTAPYMDTELGRRRNGITRAKGGRPNANL
ncbi:phage tail tape measure protein [Aeribacillus composti]|uniref:phage tail tape measure protein n=1 Tax=Aeribacillus composti TaxID=1868734 RepID=UPI00406A8E53